MDRNVNYFQNAPDPDVDYFKGDSTANVGNRATSVAQPMVPPVEPEPFDADAGGDDLPTLEDYQRVQREKDELAEARQRDKAQLDALAADRMQRENDRARQAWDGLEQQAKAAAAEMEYQQSHDYLASFYKQREAAILNNSNDMLMKFAGNVYVKDVVQRYGLKPEDVVMLGSDPNRYDDIASRIKSERDEANKRYEELEKQIRQQGTSQYVQGRVASGAYVNGGGGGRDLPVDTSQLSERDHLRYLMTGQLPSR